jgi:hypothetical protein
MKMTHASGQKGGVVRGDSKPQTGSGPKTHAHGMKGGLVQPKKGSGC